MITSPWETGPPYRRSRKGLPLVSCQSGLFGRFYSHDHQTASRKPWCIYHSTRLVPRYHLGVPRYHLGVPVFWIILPLTEVMYLDSLFDTARSTPVTPVVRRTDEIPNSCPGAPISRSTSSDRVWYYYVVLRANSITFKILITYYLVMELACKTT